MPEAWVYMLRCADGSLYTGWTVDVQRRLACHQAGKASRYTASRLPVELAWMRQVSDRGAALREEARIKRLPRGQKLALVAQLRDPHGGAPLDPHGGAPLDPHGGAPLGRSL